jgi:superfamily II DNA or RNA helicase
LTETLRPDQIEDLSHLIANPKHMMLHEPSCGKTPTICVMQWYLWSELGVGTVWIMPKTLLGKNREELLRFTPFLRQQVVIVEKEEQIKPGRVVFLMTAERHRRSWKKLPEYVRAIHIDEFHKMYKNWESSRTTELRSHVRKTDWFVPMTGTLINGRIETAFPAIHLIEPRYYGSWEAFKAYHIVTDDFSGTRIGTRNEAKLGEILKRHSSFRSFEEIHGKESKVIFTETVDMHPAQREIYDKLEEDALVELEQFFIDGTHPGVKLIRARQIMEHPNQFPDLRDPLGKTMIDICPGEAPAKQDRMEIHFSDHYELGTPVVVFASLVRQQKALMALAEKCGLTTALINGETSGAQRWQIDKDFRAGKIQAPILSPQCADVGLNWQFWGDLEVDHTIFASLDYLDTTFIQAYRRFIRGKRKKPLRITVQQYRTSIDQKIFGILLRKSKEANLIDGVRQIINLNDVEEALQ